MNNTLTKESGVIIKKDNKIIIEDILDDFFMQTERMARSFPYDFNYKIIACKVSELHKTGIDVLVDIRLSIINKENIKVVLQGILWIHFTPYGELTLAHGIDGKQLENSTLELIIQNNVFNYDFINISVSEYIEELTDILHEVWATYAKTKIIQEIPDRTINLLSVYYENLDINKFMK